MPWQFAFRSTIAVEREEEVYRYVPANNGAGPMWTHGNTCIVRGGDELLASGIETLPDYQPLNNVRWTLFQRGNDGWTLRARGDGTHEREPCPLVLLPDGRALLSVNPSSATPDEYDRTATPQMLVFDLHRAQLPPRVLTPVWSHPNPFHAHTYRSFAADAGRGEFILLYSSAYDRIIGRSAAPMVHGPIRGRWSSHGVRNMNNRNRSESVILTLHSRMARSIAVEFPI